MKQKLKTTTKLLTLFLLIALSSCQKDFDEDVNLNQNQYNVKKYSFEQANKIPKFNIANSKIVNGFDKLRKQTTNNSKEEQLSFAIDSTTIKEISLGENYTTYTMLVEKDDPTQEYFENIIVEVKPDSTVVYLAKYTPTQEIEYNQIHDEYNFVGDIQTSKVMIIRGPVWLPGGSTQVDNNPGGGGSYYCVTVLKCNYGGTVHNAGANCTNVYSVYECYGTASSGGGGGGSGGSSSNPSDPIPTNPVTSTIPPPPTPCKIMADKSGSLIFKNKVAYLKQPNILSQNHEDGFAESRDANGSITYPQVTANPQTHALQFPASLKMVGFVHDHQNDYLINGNIKVTIKNFSPKDLFTFVTHVQTDAISLGIPSSQTYGVVITSEGAFALKLLGTNIDNLMSDAEWIEFDKKYKKKAQELQTEGLLNSENVQKMLLTFMKEYGLYEKVGLFEADTNLTSWSRKTLDNNGDLAPGIPCVN